MWTTLCISSVLCWGGSGTNEVALAGPDGFLQIPGPNPILTPGPEGSWDGTVIEASDAFKDFGTYHLYYHGNGGGTGYQLGVATSSHPLGPFAKHGDEPILALGEKGTWDDVHVACAMILKEGADRYFMWYSGMGAAKEHRQWSIGLATADHPLGPWTKYEANPIIKNFGYVGGVVKVKDKYHLYTAHPIGLTGPDYSPMAVATAAKPQGPWTIYARNPVLRQGDWGEWDDGGFSEAEVLYHNGVFHMFYGGAKLYKPRIATRESVGYAYSENGFHFAKYRRNPVASREAEPNAAAYAEVHSIIEPPFVYVYHTLRYKKPWRPRFEEQFPTVEDLGVQILVLQRPFRVDMPVLTIKRLEPGAHTSLAECPTICTSQVEKVAMTLSCGYGEKAKAGIRVHVRSSPDGARYDTGDLHMFSHDFGPGRTCRKTFSFEPAVRFIKVAVENLDGTAGVSNVEITATLSG